MKNCDLCSSVDLIHIGWGLQTTKVGFFAVGSVGLLFQNEANTLMEEPENQKFRIRIQSWLNLIGWLIQTEQKWKDL